MCGFVGFFGSEVGDCDDEGILRCMSDAIIHRGPDDGGVWLDREQHIAMGHRRLSILDLTSAGHQPMFSRSGRYIIAFNGEIYNHLDLRKELEAALCHSQNLKWCGHSDTETLLACIEHWGLELSLNKAIGMFAIALWDKETANLYLCRDRFGEKPIYYGWQRNKNSSVFLFGSELNALKVHPIFSGDIDRNSICLLLRHNYIPAPYSIYKNIFKLEPGCILSVSLMQTEPKILKYWDTVEIACSLMAEPFAGSLDDAVSNLDALIKNSVRQQMIADVPLGAFLSGGVDSSLVVAMMQSQSSRPIKTFSIGFMEDHYNEAIHAKAVAQYLETDHCELYVTPEQAMEVIPELPSLYSEPFADSSQIPTFILSKLAKKQVTVSLSGDGGDELFVGYNRYQLTPKIWKKLEKIPLPLRSMASKLITLLPTAQWDRVASTLLSENKYQTFGNKVHKGAELLISDGFNDLYLGVVSQITDPSGWVIGGFEPLTKLTTNSKRLAKLNDVNKMLLLDTISYLPDDILVKVDRAAMGCSLETRIPLLDHRIVELSWSLPLQYKLVNGQTKWPLRQLLYKYVPQKLVDRPKMGFGIPIGDWLVGPLKDWAETLLAEDKLRRDGYFHPEIVRTIWEEHLSGRRNWQSQLWTILMFQAWLENER